MKQCSWLYLLVFSLLFSSCITNKDVVYLQDKGTKIDGTAQISTLAKPYRLQVNDILSIDVKALDKELVEIFNPTSKEIGNTPEALYFTGFTVDLGYTVKEVEKKVEKLLLLKYFKETAQIFVTVKLAGLKYTTLGEISNRGTRVLYQDRVNILEAIANAGDIRDTGDRKDVLILRQYPEGQKIHHIDLTDYAALKSEFFYIKPNDIIMVKPLKRKALGAGQTAVQSITAVASIFSVLVSTFFLVRNL
jgi:polysaccharide export outer membrane protein